MKRWQDRGEVQDSDDEELGLDDESQSPERALKKPRLDDDHGDSNDVGAREGKGGVAGEDVINADADEDEAEWLQPKKTSTYSKKAGLPRRPSFHDTESLDNLVDKTEDNTELDRFFSSHTSRAESRPASTNLQKSSQSEELPDVPQILAGDANVQREKASGSDSGLSSVLSSPLSEREVSPPAPNFLFPRLHGGTVADVITTPAEDEQHEVQELATGSLLPDDHSLDHIARRNLRTRNEKQLHPYMFDRAQYHRQWRARGLVPIRCPENEKPTAATQDGSVNGDGDSSQDPSSSSPAQPSSPLGGNSMSLGDRELVTAYRRSREHGSGSEEDLPDMPRHFVRSRPNTVRIEAKRRRLLHSRKAERSRTLPASQGQQDEFSVPPSPPPTSSDTPNAYGEQHPAIAGFRMPRGLTPAPLPTPQISSDHRNDLLTVEDEQSDADLPSRRSRISAVSQLRSQPAAEASSAASSEAEPNQGVDERRLVRERKRIRGVLPASWLKIDFNAQRKHTSPSPSRRRRNSSPSPPSTMPQKGVAQRVVRARSPTQGQTITISDDESERDDRPSSPSPRRMRQLRLQFERERTGATSAAFVDDERMEVDWIDPMFGSSTRARSVQATKKRQPRIQDAFKSKRHEGNDLSKEQRGSRQAGGRASGHVKSKNRSTARKATKPTPAHNLSIVDAPKQQNDSIEKVLSFVRLAMRTARARKDHGRHSPTQKHIRLAREEDTEDAMATLSAWREGTIVPQGQALKSRSHDHVDLTGDVQDHHSNDDAREPRVPLTELSGNHQERLPEPLRKESGEQRTRRTRVAVAHRPRMQQTRLNPAGTSAQQHAPHSQTPRELNARARDTRKQPRNSLHAPQYRGAQLESLENDFDQNHRAAAFERRMQLLTESVARGPRQNRSNDFQLERFLHDQDTFSAADQQNANDTPRKVHQNHPRSPAALSTLPHRPRKRQPRRLDAEAREYRQPSEPLPDIINIDDPSELPNASSSPVLQGLGPFGTRYATDFDIIPLALGTYFHESSFIGSGDFAASLNFSNRDLDIPTGHIRIHVDGDVLEWGSWADDVTVGLSRILATISNALKPTVTDFDVQRDPDEGAVVLSNLDYLLRSLVRYFARCLAFLDPVDRRTCIQNLQSFIEDLLEAIIEHDSMDQSISEAVTRCLQYALVLSNQARELSDHPLVQQDVRNRCKDLMIRVAHRLARDLFPKCLAQLRSFYEDNRHAAKREAGIRDSDTAVCGTVVLHHILGNGSGAHSSFWTIVHDALDVNVSNMNAVPQLDKVWFNIFTLLPMLEIDEQGIACIGSRMHGTKEDWSLVKRLAERLFELYPSTSSLHGSTINEYVRATLVRCYRLCTRWGWWRCEPVLGTIFDFFARRGLAQLHKEDSRGSPKFLDDLSHHPSLEVQAEDHSFHIFLKMLASGLQGMQKHAIYTDKKIGGIAWRFIPNHGRTYRKDSEVRREDLDALRNHHDLLCTLYYATPPGHRLRVQLVQNLVDHSASHREACRLNVRAWANLASFQMSTIESKENINPFIAWYRDILNTTIQQYRLARTEVEQDVASAEVRGAAAISQSVIEDTISRNQRQIAATIVDALAAVKRAVRCSSSFSNAFHLLEASAFWQIYELYDPSARRLHGVIDEALEIVKAALDTEANFNADVDSQSRSEDSQDYGDSSALQELASTQPPERRNERTIADVLHGPLSHLISNVFGADAASDDVLLTKMIDIWTRLGQTMVRAGKRSWASYISDYSSEAWSQLRDTKQRRKFTPYFLSRLVELGDLDPRETGILTMWLRSLVEREAMLKSQHTLTNALLNRYPNERLLRNLPFSRHSLNQFDISSHELRQRRVALLSGVLSNMQQDFNDAMHDRPHAVSAIRREYADMLKQLMQAMKSNYQEVQTTRNEEIADVRARGAYVEFVQQIISFMQQYTTDICQVDRFFTDSAAFPLPATDPTYVVGRLRAYVPKLVESRKRKELAVFVQTVSERAAADSQQAYLTDQLVAAMAGVLERGHEKTPSLRHVLITAVFPGYIENALPTAWAWIVALPILRACGRIAREMLYNVILESEASVDAVANTLGALLQSMSVPVKNAVAHPGLLALPHVQTTLTAIFDTARDCLTCVQFLQDSTQMGNNLSKHLAQFTSFVETIESQISQPENLDTPQFFDNDDISSYHCSWPDTLDFSRKQIHDKLNNDWHASDGQYFLKRGNTSVEVVVSLKDADEGQVVLLEALGRYRESYNVISGRGGRRGHDTGVDELIV